MEPKIGHSPNHRLQSLDGLRAISILLVVVAHAWLGHIVPGGLGVTIFFFISGYIITRLMLEEFVETSDLSIRHFYIRRFFRLMPALVVYVAVSLAAMAITNSPWLWSEVFAVIFYFANYFSIFWSFSGEVMPPPLTITWSLAVEEHFYLLFPAAFYFAIKFPKKFLIALLGLMVVALVWRCYLVYGVGLENLLRYRVYKATDTRFDSILFGVVFSLLTYLWPKFHEMLSKPFVFFLGLGLLLLSLIIRNEEFRESFRYSLQGLSIFLMFEFLILRKNVLSSILSNAIFIYIGRVSYSLYLYHWLAFGLVSFYIPDASMSLRVSAMFALSFAMAHLSYYYIEKPFLILGRHLGNPSVK